MASPHVGQGWNKGWATPRVGLGPTGYRYYGVNTAIAMLIHQQSHQGRIILQPKFLRRDRSLPLAERTAAHHEGLSLCHISFIEETQGLRLGPYLGGTLNNLPSIQTLIYLKFWLCLNPSYLQSCPCLSEIGGRGETQQSYSSATLCVLLIGCSPPHRQRPQWTWQPRQKFSLLRCKQRGLWRSTATARHWNVRLEHIAPSRMSCNDICWVVDNVTVSFCF